jgi:1,4-alpha-glucan branching enzyme
MDAIDNGRTPNPEWLEAVRREDGLFPLLNAADWATPPGGG